MTFVALAKSLGHAFSSSSSSSAASSSGSRQRPPVSATPSHEHKSNKSSLSDNGWSSADAEKDAKQVAEELGVSPQDELKTVAIPTDMPKETPGDEAEDGEDMDIASSRASSPAPIVVSRDSLDDASSDGVPYTPPPAQPLELADEPSTSVLLGKVDVERSRYELPEPSLDKKMSDEQLDQAKILVLDLLGWGVSPEYLIERGVSHALVYTVFMDLRLKLPDKVMEDCVRLVSSHSS